MEESPVTQEALRRLPKKELAERAFRHRRAFQTSIMHTELPKNEWTKKDEDVQYLQPYIKEVEAEQAELDKYNNLKLSK